MKKEGKYIKNLLFILTNFLWRAGGGCTFREDCATLDMNLLRMNTFGLYIR